MRPAIRFLITTIYCFALVYSVAAQEFSFGGELGATLFSGFQHNSVTQEGGLFRRAYSVPHNEGWIVNYYPDTNRLFFSLAFTRFHPSLFSIYARVDGAGDHQATSAPINHLYSLNMGHQLDIGKYISLPDDRCFFEPFYGVGLEWVGITSIIPIEGPIIYSGDFKSKTGLSTSLQGGFRFSYRYRRSKFSLKTIANLGLRYYATTDFLVALPEPVFTTFRSKGDFVAAQVSYEYLFKSDWTKKKKRHPSENTTVKREKIQELKIGVHPYAIDRYISFNYELFTSRKNKSLFLDITYFNDRHAIPVNTGRNPLTPEYELETFREPRLDIHLGRQLYAEKAKGYRWGIGYYLRSEIRIARNQQYISAFNEVSYSPLERFPSYYFAIGSNLQYKWLFGERWTLAPMLLTDLGVGSRDMGFTKHVALFRPIYLDVQGRLYIGYRF